MIKLIQRQKGFTTLGLIIFIGLIGIISAAATIAIHQVLIGTTLSNDQKTAINQVRNAGYWVEHDALMAQSVSTPGGSNILELTLKNWDSTQIYTVSYSLLDSPDGLKELRRNRDGQQMLIAQYIDSGNTNCTWDALERVLTVTFTAQVGEKTETRTFEVRPRPDVTS